jgi:hypothetical protein
LEESVRGFGWAVRALAFSAESVVGDDFNETHGGFNKRLTFVGVYMPFLLIDPCSTMGNPLMLDPRLSPIYPPKTYNPSSSLPLGRNRLVRSV